MPNNTDTPAKLPTCADCSALKESIFKSLSPTRLHAISSEVEARRFEKGETIFKEGEEPTGVFCVQSGMFKLTRNSVSNPHREQLVRLVRAGDVVGYSAFLQKKTHRFSAVAIEAGSACLIPGAVFNTQVERSSELMNCFMSRISKEMEGIEENLAVVGSGSVRERVAYTLWNLGSSFGQSREESTLIDVKLSRSELASLAGTVTETFVRALTDFKEEGLVTIKGRNIFIPSLENLRGCFLKSNVA